MAWETWAIFHCTPAVQVRQVEFHPVLPWVVSATKSDQITVWDWSNQQVRVGQSMLQPCLMNPRSPTPHQHPSQRPSDVPLHAPMLLPQVLYELQLGSSGDDDLHGDMELARLHARDPAVLVNPSVPTLMPGR